MGNRNRGWDAAGFYLTDNTLAQEYLVQLVLERADGTVEVRDLTLDDERQGTTYVPGLVEELVRSVLVVSPVTLGTHQPASYTVTVSRPAP